MSDDPAALTFAEFPAATMDEWRSLVSGVLKGASVDGLTARTRDGIAVAPLYPRDPQASASAAGRAAAPWRIVQRIELPDAAAAASQARHELANGATGLALVLEGTVGAAGFGLGGPDAVADVLAGIDPGPDTAIDLQAGPLTGEVARRLDDMVARRGLAPAALAVSFGFDPLGDLAAGVPGAPAWSAADLAAAVTDLAARGWRGPFMTADGRVVHDAGGSEAQELAWVLAVAVSCLRALEAGGIPLADACRLVSFRLAADADQFLTMAKFRALRRLWARVEDACGLVPAPALVMAETAWRMMTRRDPFVNMLRATVAVAAAGLGGADAVTVVPHTAALGLPDGFARRIARNTQLILLQESNLARVADPAAGSGALDSLTHALCVTAWSLFQEIENAGGAAAALAAGLLQAKVAAVRVERERAVAHRIDQLTGTSAFADLAETPAAVLLAAPPASPRPGAHGVEPLPCRRLSEPFEALREASDRVLQRTGARPKAFLATLGRLADFTARADFARGLFAAGGIEAVAGDGFASREDMVEAFTASGAKLACLCGSDDAYAAEAAAAARALRASGAARVYLAGRPAEQEALRAAGVDTFVYAGCDAIEVLTAAHGLVDDAGAGNAGD